MTDPRDGVAEYTIACTGADTQIPAAQWGEAADGERGLIASSGAAYADLTPTPKRDGTPRHFVFVMEGTDSFGGYLSLDGVRALASVCHRILAEQGPCWMCQGSGLYVPASNPATAPIPCPQCQGVKP